MRRTCTDILLLLLIVSGGMRLIATTALAQPQPEQNQTRMYLPLLRGTTTISSDHERDHHQDLIFTGAWSHRDDHRAVDGDYAVSTIADATVEFTIRGDSFVLYRGVGPNGGRAEVRIDGEPQGGALEFYFPEERWQVPAIFDNLGSGPHTVMVRILERSHDASQGSAVAIDAVASPSPFVPAPHQQAAVERVNHYRELVGIPLATGVQAIHEAAQSHAAYYAAHRDDPRLKGLGFHREFSDLLGFTGVRPYERAHYFGYTGLVGEVGGALDGLMNTVYHRNGLICYTCTDIGHGMVQDESGTVYVTNTGSRIHMLPERRTVYTYPAEGQTNVRHRWSGREIPDPLPDVSVPVGVPLSLHIAQPADAEGTPDGLWNVEATELRDAEGTLVPIYVLEHNSDTHLEPDVVFLIPQKPLALHTRYTAHIAGVDSRGEAFTQTWSFTTETAAAVRDIKATKIGACDAEVYWSTAGTTTGQVRYGPESTYGQTAPAREIFADYHRYKALLTGLQPDTTYRYRITTRDVQGNEHTSAELTLTTREVRIANVPDDRANLADVLAQTRACDVVEVGPGSYDLADTLVVPAGVRLIGAGAEQTTLRGAGRDSVIHARGTSVVQGFTITGSGSEFWDAGVWMNNEDSPTISQNRIIGNAMGIASYCFDNRPCASRPNLRNNLIIDNRQTGIVTRGSIAHIANNTLTDNKHGISVDTDGTIIRNNIVVNHAKIGISGAEAAVAIGYNNVWNNNRDYAKIMPGVEALSIDPRFVAPDQDNYRLQSTSPCRDAGDPETAYNDADGSRNDMGMHGGPPQ